MPEHPVWICPTCGACYPPAARPPVACAICTDERQWVPPDGQRWTTPGQLAAEEYVADIRPIEPGLTGIGTAPGIGVGQRGVLVQTEAGNLLWDPPAYADEVMFAAVAERGGLDVVTASHPHMYGAIADWARRFDAEVLLPEADLAWLQREVDTLRAWSAVVQPLPGVTLVQCGGHFPGSAVLHWPHDGGALLAGDTVFVTPGEDRVTFMWSAPNRLPLPERHTRAIVEALRPYAFERIHSGWWTPSIHADGKAVLERGAERYLQFLRGEVDIDG